jgi:hypothetical protein
MSYSARQIGFILLVAGGCGHERRSSVEKEKKRFEEPERVMSGREASSSSAPTDSPTRLRAQPRVRQEP